MQQHVQHALVKQIVPHVHKQQTNAVLVHQDIIQMDQDVQHAQQFMDHVLDVQQQQRHVPLVHQDIMSQEEHVLNVPIQ